MYFKLSEIALSRKALSYLLLFFVVIYGYVSYQKLPKEWSPDIQIPLLYLTVPYQGTNAENIENLITYKFERELKGINQVKKISSTSRSGVATIQLEFALGFDIQEAKNEVRSAWDRAKSSLPSDVDNLFITEINLSERPILTAVVSGEKSLYDLKIIADLMKDEIETIPEILEADVIGGLTREIQVNVDQDLLDYYQVGLDAVSQAIGSSNRDYSAGTIQISTSKYSVKIPGSIQSIEEIENFTVTSRKGSPIYVKNLAEVKDGFKDYTSISRINGKNAVSLDVKKKAGENLIAATNKTLDIIKKYRETHPDIEFVMTQQESTIVEQKLSELQNNIILGFTLVFLILLFTMELRSALIVATSIPLSMLFTYMILNLIGISLNMVVLFALVLGLGMLVDNGIVVVENIYRHISAGKKVKEACLLGVTEIAYPVISSTLTTLAAFFPLLFMPDIIGEFLKYLPITLISTLASSLLVALIFTVLFSSDFLKPSKRLGKKVLDEKESAERSLFLRGYGRILEICIRNRYWTLLSCIILWVGSLAFYIALKKGIVMFPDSEPTSFTINTSASPGSNFRHINETVGFFEDSLQEFSGYSKNIISKIGAQRSNADGQIVFEFPINWYEWKARPFDVIAQIREKFENQNSPFGGVEWSIVYASGGPPTGKDVSVEIQGNDLNELKKIAGEIKDRISDLKGLVNLGDNLNLSNLQFEVNIDREKLAYYNVRFDQVAKVIRSAIFGSKASTFVQGKDEYDIYVRLDKTNVKGASSLNNLKLLTGNGVVINLSQVAKIALRPNIAQIKHENLNRIVTVSGDAEGVPGVTLLKDVQKRLADLNLPQGYFIKYTGSDEKRGPLQDFLIEAFIIAIFLIFVVLIAQFNSVFIPLIVLFSVFLSFIGVFVSHAIHGLPFSIILGGIGVVSLAGVIVNNSIVLIEYIEQLRKKGYDLVGAISIGCRLRLRPVILTATTTVVSLSPILFKLDVNFFRFKFSFSPFVFDISEIIYFNSPTGDFWFPLAIISAYGLSLGTLLTLFLTPSVYYINEDRKKAFLYIKTTVKRQIKKLPFPNEPSEV